MTLRTYLDILQDAQLNEAVEGQYMLATHSLESQSWNVRFFPSREEAFQAWHQWSRVQGISGDAYLGPVERTFHAEAKDRPIG